MLIWSRPGRWLACTLALLLFALFFCLPLLVILLSSLSAQWNDALPSGFTWQHFRQAFSGASWDALLNSLLVGFGASLLALLCGTWGALALRSYRGWSQRLLGTLFFIPSAVPSVSVGLGLLVAFSQGPLQLNGSALIVPLAHFVLISAFAFGSVSAGLARLSNDYQNVAASLGAAPWFRLWRVTLPMLSPHLISALALSLSLSMGELGATMMIYPPRWTTLPVAIFSLTDRGNIAGGAALTIILTATTLLLMLVLERLAQRLLPQHGKG